MKLFTNKALKPALHSAECIKKIEKPVLRKKYCQGSLVEAQIKYVKEILAK